MFLWGLPLALLASYLAVSELPSTPVEWSLIILLVGALGLIGLYLMYVSIFGTGESIKKAGDWISDGGEVAGLIFAMLVGILAIPITALLRALLRKK